MTDCIQDRFAFQDLGQRKLQADFTGGLLSSDGGLLLIGQLDRRLGLTERLSRCFSDSRDQRFVEHSLEELLRQRLYGLVGGYEDLNDHDLLRRDPLMAAIVGKTDPLGEERSGEDKGNPLAGKSTLNRLEIANAQTEEGRSTHYHKIHANHQAIEKTLIEMGVETLPENTQEVVLDFDATDDLIHGNQEGRFYHGYYGNYCYLPLYCFVGEVPLYAKLRTSNRDGCDGTEEALEAIVPVLRERFPGLRIIVRGDSGFAREPIMKWCEDHHCYYCFGYAKNARVNRLLGPALFRAREQACLTGYGRQFTEFRYQTQTSWSVERRVIGKAEIIRGKENPRYVVTNLPEENWPERDEKLTTAITDFSAQGIYEGLYCARGNMENRIKEQQLDMFADRTSSAKMVSNQLRLWFSTFAYLLGQQLRTCGLQETPLAKATVGTIRTRLMKVAASIRVSARRVHVRLCSAFPLQEVFAEAYERICRLPARC
jgi:hypothetical protein